MYQEVPHQIESSVSKQARFGSRDPLTNRLSVVLRPIAAQAAKGGCTILVNVCQNKQIHHKSPNEYYICLT